LASHILGSSTYATGSALGRSLAPSLENDAWYPTASSGSTTSTSSSAADVLRAIGSGRRNSLRRASSVGALQERAVAKRRQNLSSFRGGRGEDRDAPGADVRLAEHLGALGEEVGEADGDHLAVLGRRLLHVGKEEG